MSTKAERQARLAAEREHRHEMRREEIPEEIFQIANHAGVLVAAGRVGINVRLFACSPRGTAVEIAPAEARDVAAELIRLADEADALRSAPSPHPGDEEGVEQDRDEGAQHQADPSGQE